MSSIFTLTPAKVLKVSERLPGAPRVLVELDSLLRNPNSNFESLAALLRPDVALTARFIRIANGVVYARGEPVGGINEALARIGLSEAFRLIGIAGMLQMSEVSFRFYPISPKALRENALYSALLMEALAPLVGIDPRTAYTAGLIRSIGRVVLDLAAQQENRTGEIPQLPTDNLIAWERGLFGMTNYEASTHVLKHWRFPVEIVVAVRDQLMHDLSVDPMPIAKLLHVSVAAAYGAGHAMLGGQVFIDRYSAKARSDLGITDEQMARVIVPVGRRFEQMKAFLT